jgi:hypothetical protein
MRVDERDDEKFHRHAQNNDCHYVSWGVTMVTMNFCLLPYALSLRDILFLRFSFFSSLS